MGCVRIWEAEETDSVDSVNHSQKVRQVHINQPSLKNVTNKENMSCSSLFGGSGSRGHEKIKNKLEGEQLYALVQRGFFQTREVENESQ